MPDSAHLDRFTLPEGTVFEPYRFTFTARGDGAAELRGGVSAARALAVGGGCARRRTHGLRDLCFFGDGGRPRRSARSAVGRLVIVDRPTPKLLETAEAIGCACSSTGSGSGLWGFVMALAAMRPYRLARRLRQSPRARPPARE